MIERSKSTIAKKRHSAAMRYTHEYLEQMLNNEAMQQELDRRIEAIVEEKLKRRLDSNSEHLVPETQNQ